MFYKYDYKEEIKRELSQSSLKMIQGLSTEQYHERHKVLKRFLAIDKIFFSSPEVSRFFFSSGNPILPAFPPLINAAKKVLEDHDAMRMYRSSDGLPDVREKMVPFFGIELGIRPQNECLSEKHIIFGNGVTGLCTSIIKNIIQNVGDVILTTAPTYGLFIDHIEAQGGKVIGITLQEKNGWLLQPKELEQAIFIITKKLEDFSKKGKLNYIPKIRGFLHINPHNPTGTIYGKKEIEDLAAILKKYPDILILDNMAYYGTEYGSKKPTLFASVTGMFSQTITLISMSKAMCATAFRIGIACGPRKILDLLSKHIFHTQEFVSTIAQVAAAEAYSWEETIRIDRGLFFKAGGQEYQYRGNLLRALVEGVSKIEDDITKERIKHDIISTAGKESVDLTHGIRGLELRCKPEASYFNLIDFRKAAKQLSPLIVLNSSIDICELLVHKLNMLLIPCELMLYPGETFLLRISYTLPIKEIILGLKALKLLLDNLEYENKQSKLMCRSPFSFFKQLEHKNSTNDKNKFLQKKYERGDVMPKIAIASEKTYANVGNFWIDDFLLMLMLQRRFNEENVTIIDWQNKSINLLEYDAIYVSSTWNSHLFPDEFYQWLEKCESDGKRRLINSREILMECFDKKNYFQILVDAHFKLIDSPDGSIIPSVFIDSTERRSFSEIVSTLPWRGDVVIKPRISADGNGTYHVTNDLNLISSNIRNRRVSFTEANRIFAELIKNKGCKGVIIQPFLSAVEKQGEYQMVFFNNVYSHTTRKQKGFMNSEGTLREQVNLATIPVSMLDFAKRVLDTLAANFGKDCSITRARIDMFMGQKGPILCEAELVDPNTNISCLDHKTMQGVMNAYTTAVVNRVDALLSTHLSVNKYRLSRL